MQRLPASGVDCVVCEVPSGRVGWPPGARPVHCAEHPGEEQVRGQFLYAGEPCLCLERGKFIQMHRE